MKENSTDRCPLGMSRATWLLIGAAAIAAYFVLTEHRAHFIEYLPFLLVLACPLMHLFHGHGGHRHGAQATRDDRAVAASKPKGDASE